MPSREELKVYERPSVRKGGIRRKLIIGGIVLGTLAGGFFAENKFHLTDRVCSIFTGTEKSHGYPSPEQAIEGFYSERGIRDYRIVDARLDNGQLAFNVELEDPENPGVYIQENFYIFESDKGWSAYMAGSPKRGAESPFIKIPYREGTPMETPIK